MKNNNQKTQFYFHILTTLAIIPILLAACQSDEPVQIPTQELPISIVEDAEEAMMELPVSSEPTISLNMGTLVEGMIEETVPAVLPNSERPYWEILPEHNVFTLEGYEISEHLLDAQIFIYPVAELGLYNANAAQAAEDLENLLDDQAVGETLPFLPLFNAAQVMHAQVEFLDFQNGKGVRFLTQFDQAPIPINNYELIYTFQGLTNDGKYYIAAIFPVTHPDLPENNRVGIDQEFVPEQFAAEMAESVEKLDKLPMSSFSPDLNQLDTLIQSIEIK